MPNSKRITDDLVKARNFFIDKISFTLGPVELKYWIDEKYDIQIVDLRTEEEYEEGHIPHSIYIPHYDIKTHLHLLAKDKITVLYCYNMLCQLAAKCAIEFIENGYKVMELEGGIKEWQRFHYDLEK